MEPLDFLAAVLPSTGVYCAVELSSKKKEHAYVTTLEEMHQHVERFNTADRDTYFALASFKEAGNRLADNAAYMRSLFVDLDCGEGKEYPNQKAAVLALQAFITTTGMPDPILVNSGGGVHAYWAFIEDVEIPRWKLLAENFKRLCKQHGLGIDFTVTADAARVLRVPGTKNWKLKKNPRPVVIKNVPDTLHHEFDSLVAVVAQTLEEPQEATSKLFDVPGQRLAPPNTPSLVKVLENRVTFFKAIIDRTDAGNGCGQLAHYVSHAKDEGMEPLWRGMLSLAKVCEDGEKAAKFLTKLHPYTEARMQTKLREIKGPYPCVKFDSENPGICTKCAFWGKVTNPLAFGHSVQTDVEEKTVDIPATPASLATTIVRPKPPFGYAYGAKGGVYRQVKDVDAEGEEVVVNKMVLAYDLFVVDLLNSTDDGHQVQLMAMRPEGAKVLVLPQKCVVSKDETVKHLAQQNIIAAYGSGNDQHLFSYVRACVEDISAARGAIKIPDAFGWQPDNSFVLNGRVIDTNGEKVVPMPKLANLVAITTPSGTLEEWKQVPQLLINKGYHDLLAMALVGFGSPLMQFSNFKALTFHIGSSASGTGKSVSLSLAASVWGSGRYIMSPHSSAVAQEHRAGALGQLPLIIDEITEMNKDGNFDWLSSFVLEMTSGQGKERLKSAVNEERVNTTFWRSLMLLASNTHTTDFFGGVRKKSADGHLLRLLELKLNNKITWTPSERKTIGLLERNHGVAGPVYAQWLVHNKDKAAEVYEKVFDRLEAEITATGDERFWVAGCAAIIAGGYLLGSKYSGIIDMPMQGITEALKKMIYDARGVVVSSRRDAEDILNAYTREFFGNFIVVRINDKTKTMETSFGSGGATDQTLTRSQVKGRVEHDVVPGHINYYIEEALLKAWCSSMNYGYADFREQLEKKFVVTYGKKDMFSKTRGPQMRVNVIKITRPETTVVDEIEDHVPVG